MTAFPTARHLRFALLALTCVVAAPLAGASEVALESARLVYATGTAAAPATARTGLEALEATEFPLGPQRATVGTWRVASVDATRLPSAAATVTFQPATFEGDLPRRAASQVLSTESSSLSAATSGNAPEPGFWTAALSTLALAVFFFLRRLS